MLAQRLSESELETVLTDDPEHAEGTYYYNVMCELDWLAYGRRAAHRTMRPIPVREDTSAPRPIADPVPSPTALTDPLEGVAMPDPEVLTSRRRPGTGRPSGDPWSKRYSLHQATLRLLGSRLQPTGLRARLYEPGSTSVQALICHMMGFNLGAANITPPQCQGIDHYDNLLLLCPSGSRLVDNLSVSAHGRGFARWSVATAGQRTGGLRTHRPPAWPGRLDDHHLASRTRRLAGVGRLDTRLSR